MTVVRSLILQTIAIIGVVMVMVAVTPQTTSAASLAEFAGCTGTDCSACNVASLANGVIQWIIGFLFVLFAGLMAWAGFGLVTSNGNQQALDQAKEYFVNAVVGLIIILSAWLIVDTIMRALVGNSANPGSVQASGRASGWLFWSEIECFSQITPENVGEYVPEPVEIPVADLSREFETLTNGCQSPNASPASLRAAGCRFTPCTTTQCLTSCTNVVRGSDVGLASGNYCASAPTQTTGGSGGTGSTGGVSATPVSRSGMQSLRAAGVVVADWPGINGPGRTDLAHPRVVSAVQQMHRQSIQMYGRPIFQITAAFTEGVGHSANSRHYQGIAVDLDPIGGGTNAQVVALARAAGFTFILDEGSHVHADMR